MLLGLLYIKTSINFNDIIWSTYIFENNLITTFICKGDSEGEGISFGGHLNKTFKQVTKQVFANSSNFIDDMIKKMKKDIKWVVKIIYPFGLCLQMIEYNKTRDLILTWNNNFTLSKGSG